ncbi:BNR-4 repeat-containing protein [Aliiglaciecola sp. 3_MG-2023]|uniref:BNR-4 repeat-containing protein n=1 Tax=Aliiglaciecola sp. 3_MG-2023 TaxID=3062644 RepID=UPI0026E1F8F7|nr:BNR-4 repeat-containing protein [Aliiglaciecola sp. 3_MG-2023]MDO6693303.1 BNR-4 repeat-containing protein [Aliiglaciecola sp. 3_MG-2023]
MLKYILLLTSSIGFTVPSAQADVTLESQVKITDQGLHFDGQKVGFDAPNNGTDVYDYHFGKNISAHGDSVKSYKHYVFMTWYRGGKDDRHVMLSRYNTETGTVKTIEFPHRHTGFRGDWWVGESHNTIGLAVSPINGTIHMVYDMHAYDNSKYDGKFEDDYFRYSFSVPGAAEVPDDEFTLEQFVEDSSDISQSDPATGYVDYKHLVMTGDLADRDNFSALTYPKFFETNDGTLLLYMRWGGNNNGAYYFNRYDASEQKWSTFTPFNHKNQKTTHGNAYNWGLYGNMKYVNGKLRVGFQQRSNDNNDRYIYQNGVYYAYSDHPEGLGEWKNHKNEPMTWPLVNSDEIKVFEPGDYISHQEPNSVYIVGDFDWTVTEKGDVHIISLVRSTDRTRPDYEEVYIHSYKPAGADDFIIDTDFVGASNIYTAGDNIYIIGLQNGRPYVEKAVGGTSDFERVYEETEGPVFDHGTVYVKNGKVYYYLMERTSGNAMPLHLQVIDLDIEADATRPTISFPNPSVIVEQGYEKLALTLSASSPIEDRSIESVTLYIDDELVRVDDTLPYLFGHGSKPHETGAMGWRDDHEPNPTPLGPGVHIFKAVALDSEGQTASAYMQLTVNSTAPIVTFPQSSMSVDLGYEKLGITIDAQPSVADRTIESVTLYLNGEIVREDTSSPYNFGHQYKPHETGAMGWISCDQDPVPSPCHPPNPSPLGEGEHTFTAVAIDSAGETSQASMTLMVNGLPQPPVVQFPKEVYEVTEGYEQLGLTINAESPVSGRSIVSVTLYRNGELVRVDTKPVWNFGHKYAPYELGAMGWISCDEDPVPSPCHEPNPNPLLAGEHTFTAIAVDSEGLEGEASMTLIVKPSPAPTITFNESDVSLPGGYDSFSLSVDITSVEENDEITVVGLYFDDSLVRELYEAPFLWGSDFYETELLGLTAGIHTVKAVVMDSEGRTNEASMLIEVGIFGDLNADGDVDKYDMRAFTLAVRNRKITNLNYDFNGDGVVNSRDVQGFTSLCSRARCAIKPTEDEPDTSWIYRQEGNDPTWAEVLATDSLQPLGTFTSAGVMGSTVTVNKALLETGEYGSRAIDTSNYKIHTVGNSAIRSDNFHRWSRWYQEDGNTQIFRLFKDEENVSNSRALAARVEVFSSDDRWLPEPGVWREFSAKFTVLKSAGCSNQPVKQHYCSIFQAKGNNVDHWSVMLRVHGDGSLWFYPRGASPVQIAANVINQPFDMKVRDNGLDYEMWVNGESVGTGQWQRTEEIGFRWGIYVGETQVLDDIMVLVTGATMH